MVDKTILHIRVGDGSSVAAPDELEHIRDILNKGLEDWGLDDEYEALVTGADVSMAEVPALDDHIDEIAEQVAEKLD